MTQEVLLTKGYKAVVDVEDYRIVKQHSWYADVHPNGLVYAKCDDAIVGGRRLHQFILQAKGVDHKDGDGLNNTRKNLRVCPQSVNSHNTRFQRNGTSGVWFNQKLNRYEVTVTVHYKKHYIGVTRNYEEALNMRKKARHQLLGEPI